MNFNFLKDKYLSFDNYIDFKYFLMQMILYAVFAVIITEMIRINNLPHQPGIISRIPKNDSMVPSVEALVPA